jgi:uncharacterized protein (TIGR02145 family)
MMKKIAFFLTAIIITLATIFIACSKTSSWVYDVTLNHTQVTIHVGETLQLVTSIHSVGVTNIDVTWSSSDTTVATISNGKISGISVGSATIVATSVESNQTAICEVSVIYVPVTGVRLNQTSVMLQFGTDSVLQLTATILPANATNKVVTWRSNNPSVATVDSNGKVSTITPGTTTITVRTQDGNRSASCNLTVRPLFGCRLGTPNWGPSLGTASFATTQEWIVGSQIWSDAVQATACDKTNFNGGLEDNFNSDCRSNPSQKGDLFSWCAVVRFQDELCPAPWRVPVLQDFIDLDIALGGTGNGQINNMTFLNKYLNEWGGSFGGLCQIDGRLINQGERDLWTGLYWISGQGHYWAQSEDHLGSYGRSLGFTHNGNVWVQSRGEKLKGYALRCIK